MIEHSISLTFPHRVVFTRGAFSPGNTALDRLIALSGGGDRVQRFLVFVDKGVAESSPGLVESIRNFFLARDGQFELAAAPLVMGAGEDCKNDWDRVPAIWAAINEAGIDRHSYVIAIGGGAFLDLVGFASATAHRGIRHLRMPTTTLSQGDGGVGVKNGVNFFGKKNWVGTFSIPYAILNDLNFIDSLPERERRAGIIEAIKVSLIRDSAFFERMEAAAGKLAVLEPEALEMVIRRSAELHVEHIATGGDPFELGSARPLDFGHWVAHKLEQVSGFSVGHGEAVAIGIAVDLLYSVKAGILDAATCDRILALIEGIGFQLFSPYVMAKDGDQWVILRGLEEFREHLGGELTITLVPEIGKKLEVNEMDEALVLEAMHELEARFATMV
jgi:3-dehydroquinate synthase